MTIRERLRIAGQGLVGKTVAPVVQGTPKNKQKAVTGGFLDFQMKGLSNQTRISNKLLEANNGWVYRNNDVIAKEVANIEFELFTVKFIGGEIVYDPIVQSPLLDVLDRFNEFTSASDGFYTTQSHRKLAGDCFWFLDGQGPNVNNIFIIPPDKVKILLGKEAGSMRVIDGYEYTDNIDGKRVNIVYDPKNIIHFKVPNPQNFYRGKSAVEAAADAIDTDAFAIEANRKMFERGLISNFILSTDKGLTPEQLKQLRAEFRAEYGGVEKAFTVPILSGGLKPESVQMSNRDAEFIAQQEWVRDKIASLFGNNKAVLGVTDDVNRANAEATVMHWKRTTIRSEMKGITDTLNEFLVPRYGSNLVLGFKDPVEEDEGTKIEKVVKKKNAGLISVNEAREELSYDEVTGGDELAFQREDRQVRELPKSLKFVNRKRVLRRAGIYEKAQQYATVKKQARMQAKKLLQPKQKQQTQTIKESRYTEDQIMDYHNKRIAIVNVHDKVFKDKVEQFISVIVDKAIEAVPEEIALMQKKDLFSENDLQAQAVIDFTPILMGVAKQSADHAMDMVGSNKPFIEKDLEPEIIKRVKWFANSMLNTDKDKLVGIIRDGIQEGQSVTEIRNSISETFDVYSKTQAERVARTEVLHASNQAAVEAWKQTGQVAGKQWLVANPIDECLAYSGDVVPLNKSFPQGDPPVHPNCECTLIPVLKDEKAYKKSTSLADELRRTKEQLEDEKQYAKKLEEYIDEQN